MGGLATAAVERETSTPAVRIAHPASMVEVKEWNKGRQTQREKGEKKERPADQKREEKTRTKDGAS